MFPVKTHRSRLWVAMALVLALVGVLAGGLILTGPAGGQPVGGTGALIMSPQELLGESERTQAAFRQGTVDSFFDVFADLSTDQMNACNTLLREARRKGYKLYGERLPGTCVGLEARNPRGSFMDAALQGLDQGGAPQSTQVVMGLFVFDTHSGHRSRAYLDVAIDTGDTDRSFIGLTLTNNWSDQPEVVKASTGSLTFNGEPRFFVDVAQVLNGQIYWYHYWWYDSHHHPWWWYGPYWWWWWWYRWWAQPWWWWWNWWWPWWHYWHWNSWSTWWADLKPCCP
jgi:hypothetical protein